LEGDGFVWWSGKAASDRTLHDQFGLGVFERATARREPGSTAVPSTLSFEGHAGADTGFVGGGAGGDLGNDGFALDDDGFEAGIAEIRRLGAARRRVQSRLS
jgi:hypothetical protein